MPPLLLVLVVLWLAGCQSAPVRPMNGIDDTRQLDAEENRLWHSSDELDEQLERADYLYEDEALRVYLVSVMQKLYPEYGDAIRVRVVSSPSLNAFALPNGSIYINTGMLVRLDNEAQLATVLAHEGVHFTHKHSWQQRRNVKNSTALSTSFGILIGIPAVGDLMALSSMLGFSRDLEREADAEGFQRLAMADYDVTQAPVTFEHLLDEVEALDIDEPYFFSTHPALVDRIESFNALVQQHGPVNGYRGEQAYRLQVKGLQLGLLQDYLELGQYQSVLLILERPDAFARYPQSAWYYLGEAYRQRGEDEDTERSATAYKSAIRLVPEFAPSWRAMGLYYMKQGDAAQAEHHFGRYLELMPDAPDRAYIELYRTQLKTGDRHP